MFQLELIILFPYCKDKKTTLKRVVLYMRKLLWWNGYELFFYWFIKKVEGWDNLHIIKMKKIKPPNSLLPFSLQNETGSMDGLVTNISVWIFLILFVFLLQVSWFYCILLPFFLTETTSSSFLSCLLYCFFCVSS